MYTVEICLVNQYLQAMMRTLSFSSISSEVNRKQAWTLITDLNHWNRWDFNILRSSLLQRKLVPGALFSVKHRDFIETRAMITELDRYRSFAFRIRFLLAAMDRKFILEETEGGLKLTISTSITGMLSWFWRIAVMHKILDDTPEDLSLIMHHAQRIKIQ